MEVSTYEGTVQNGIVRLEDNIVLPDDTKVFVVVPKVDIVVPQSQYDLHELLARMPQDYKVHEESFGSPVGKEEW